ncbi:MAG TPA: hypothetical protein PLD23_00050 [Armatimonadota bacterium]|nr:hypothetical protein [Armatimonadota bacterium]
MTRRVRVGMSRGIAWLLIAVMVGIAGCGGGPAPVDGNNDNHGNGGNNGGDPTATHFADDPNAPEVVTVTGYVDRTAIGGEGLTVLSAYQQSAALSATGSFRTQVSGEGPQLLFALDQNRTLRGLAVTVSATAGASSRAAPQFDADSTAMGLLFLTPGILDTDPEGAAKVIAELKGYGTFSTLSRYLATKLPTEALADLVANDEHLSDLLSDCYSQWCDYHAPAAPEALARDINDYDVKLRVEGPSPWSRFKVPGAGTGGTTWNPGKPRDVDVFMENHGMRWVNIHRHPVDTDGEYLDWETVADGINSMPGAVPLSIGSLLTWTQFQEAKGLDSRDTKGISCLEYWIRGPGFAAATEPLPDDIPESTMDAWGISIVLYVFFPIIAVISGISNARFLAGGDKLPLTCTDLYKSIASSRNFMDMLNNLRTFIGHFNWKSATRAVVQIVLTGISLIGAEGVEALLAIVCVGMSAAAASDLAALIIAVLSVIGGALHVANVGTVVYHWATMPHADVFRVYIDGTLDVTVSGARGAMLRPAFAT